jgi:NAD(P)-dependent dehydrogenase (short-subunit alcohol dehydrogenase family)
MSMQGKIIAITGGASGIGLATAKLVASRGATICLADWDASALSAAESYFTSLGVAFSASKVDVSKNSEVVSWIDSIIAQFGRLDGAANVAGIIGKHHGVRPVAELDDEEWDRIIAINLTGLMYCLRAELRKIADFGSIVNITSVQGTMGLSLPLPFLSGLKYLANCF